MRNQYRDIPEDQRPHGSARFAGPTTLLVGDDIRVEARAVIVATGASPQIPASLKAARALMHTHETLFDIEALPASLAVVGAGPLGLEMAQAFARLGVAVTVLDNSDKLGLLTDPQAEQVARRAFEKDFAIYLGVTVDAVMDGSKARLSWTGDSAGAVAVDMVLTATGREPKLAGLDLGTAGIETDDKDVPSFDPHTHRCGDTSVFLAGDADIWRPVLHEAARGGTTAGLVAVRGAPLPQRPALSIALTEPNLVQVGTKFDELPDGAIVGTAAAVNDARSGIDGELEGLARLYAAPSGKLLGGTIVLTGGEHLGQSLALAIDRDMDAASFADQAWYHPVLEEMLQAAARDIVRQVRN